ncbi:MAG: hypothetical protein HQ593_05660 [Candidatus Omnitrophica bacterium]|nr:hypothetical protein [Candidatus Omnitrophota bacterium]
MIELIIDSSPYKIPGSKTKLDLVRIKCLVGFKEKNGSNYRFNEGIIDTGAYVSIIPKGLSERIEKEITGRDRVKGINSREECAIPASVGKAKCILFDRSGNASDELEFTCYFANSDEVPIIIGFADVLTRFKINIDYPNRKAFLE